MSPVNKKNAAALERLGEKRVRSLLYTRFKHVQPEVQEWLDSRERARKEHKDSRLRGWDMAGVWLGAIAASIAAVVGILTWLKN